MELWGILPLFGMTSKSFNHHLIALIYSPSSYALSTQEVAASQERPRPILYANHRNGTGSRQRVGHFLAQEEKKGFRSWKHPGPALPEKVGTVGPRTIV